MKECRTYNFEMRAEENEKHGTFVNGQAIVFGDKYDNGAWDEYIEQGALDKTDMRDVRLLVNHNTDMIPLARSRNNTENSTMQLISNERGLFMRADLDTENNADAKALYSATKRGDISGMSFMFTVNEDKWEGLDTDHPTRHILSIDKIFEVSAVTFPAYEATSLEARDAMTEDSIRQTLESAKQSYEEERAKEAEHQRQIEIAKAKIKIMAL